MIKGLSPDQVFKRHGGLRWQVLLILSNGPKRGIDIMDSIERAAWGFWRPSPGTVYPLLKSLEKEGLVNRTDSMYTLTGEGRNTIGLNPADKDDSSDLEHKLERTINELESYVDYLEDMKSSIGNFRERIEKTALRLKSLCNLIEKKEERK